MRLHLTDERKRAQPYIFSTRVGGFHELTLFLWRNGHVFLPLSSSNIYYFEVYIIYYVREHDIRPLDTTITSAERFMFFLLSLVLMINYQVYSYHTYELTRYRLFHGPKYIRLLLLQLLLLCCCSVLMLLCYCWGISGDFKEGFCKKKCCCCCCCCGCSVL